MIDFDKPVTCKGNPVRVISKESGIDGFPIVATVTLPDGWKYLDVYNLQGKPLGSGLGSGDDLDGMPIKRTGWVNLHPISKISGRLAKCSNVHETRESADASAAGRFDCIEVTWTE